MKLTVEQLNQAANEVLKTTANCSGATPPKVAIQLGTGMAQRVEEIATVLESFAYSDLYQNHNELVISHRGNLSLATIANQSVALFCGRYHLYEGYSALEVCSNVMLAKSLGCTDYIVINAAGGLSNELVPGDVALITDHLNMTGENPLVGLSASLMAALGIEHPFVDMHHAYCSTARHTLKESAQTIDIKLKEGIYAGVKGPSLETAAERRMLTQLGAQLVGMSSVNEVIMARALGLRVSGISIVTNMATGGPDQVPDSIDEILHYARTGAEKVMNLLHAMWEQPR